MVVPVNQAGQIAVDGGFQREAVLGDELEDERRGERLGHAADAQPVDGVHRASGAQIRRSGGLGQAPAGLVRGGVAHQDRGPGDAVAVGEDAQRLAVRLCVPQSLPEREPGTCAAAAGPVASTVATTRAARPMRLPVSEVGEKVGMPHHGRHGRFRDHSGRHVLRS